MKSIPALSVSLVILLMCAGCEPVADEPVGDPTVTTNGESSIKPSENGSPNDTGVTLNIASWEEVQNAVAAEKGKIVVLDLWSTSCPPCMKEFPHLVELHESHGDKVVCMSMSLDYFGSKKNPPESYREKVLEFLTKKKATFSNFLCSDEDTTVYERLDLAGIPAVMVFDESGVLAKRFDNDKMEYGDEGFTYEQHIIPLVEMLMSDVF